MKAKKKAARVVKVTKAKAVAPASRPKTASKPKVKAASEAPKPKRTVAARKTARPKAPVKLPAVLFEGDTPIVTSVGGPGEKFALGPTPPAQTFGGTEALPDSYGTKKLFLTARDPHWLYAHWDFTREQLTRYNRLSVDGHLILRISYAPPGGGLALEVHVHPESRHWFVHVERAAAKYSAEIGYYAKGRKWTSLAKSGATLTPPETISDASAVEFATIPVDVPFAVLLEIVKESAAQHQPLARAIEELRGQGHPDLPKLEVAVSAPPTGGAAKAVASWTPAQERALAEIISLDEVRRVWIGSLEITELIRRQIGRSVSSLTAPELSLSGPGGAVTSISSPFGGEQPAVKGFWFNINAELTIYGATERDATVTIGGRQIKLRPDGSFSYRFALPDGKYDLPVVAISADGTDGRAAELKFSRATEIRGEVGTHPQDPALKPPTPESV